MAGPGLSIPQLFKIIRHSFRESEFDEVQDILMYRDKKMRIEIQDLKRNALLLENSVSLAELEKLRIEEKLQRSESKCGELDEEITRLSDRAKGAEERNEALSKEFSEKNKLILELNGKIKDKYKEEWEAQVENLRAEKLASDQLVMELMRKQYEADKEVAELKLQNLEFARREKMGSDQRVMWMGNKHVKVENLGTPDMIKGCKHSSNADADADVVMKGGRPWTQEDGAMSARTSGAKIYGSHAIPICTPGGSRRSSKKAATNQVIEISDSDDEAKPSGTVKNTRKRKLYPSPESDYKS